MHTKFWLENLSRRDLSEALGVWDNNIKIDHREIGMEGVEWIHLIQNRDQDKVFLD
jgi:hypothetical protein